MGFISGNITNFSQSGLFFFFLPLSLSLSRGKYFTSAGEGEKDTARPLLSTCKDTKVIASASVTTVGLERRAEWKKKKNSTMIDLDVHLWGNKAVSEMMCA